MKNTIQLRGNCQCCGRDHAVVRGSMSKHGYEVKNGYFAGICQGDRHQPMQIDRTVTDSVAAMLRSEANKLEVRADDLESGDRVLGLVEKPTMVEWSSLSEYQRANKLRSVVYNLRNHADANRDFASELLKVADAVHGTQLREVERVEGPAPILRGERRVCRGEVYTATAVSAGRVYYTTHAGKGWVGTQAWRKLSKVEN